MNNFQLALTKALEQNSEKLELISKGVNKLRAIYKGVVYENYSDLPKTGKICYSSLCTVLCFRL